MSWTIERITIAVECYGQTRWQRLLFADEKGPPTVSPDLALDTEGAALREIVAGNNPRLRADAEWRRDEEVSFTALSAADGTLARIGHGAPTIAYVHDPRVALSWFAGQLSLLPHQQPTGEVPSLEDAWTLAGAEPDELFYGPLRVGRDRDAVFAHGESIVLSRLDLLLFRILVRRGGQVIARETIFQEIWPGSARDIRAARRLEKHISRVRAGLKKQRVRGVAIVTMRRAGYCLVLDGQAR